MSTKDFQETIKAELASSTCMDSSIYTVTYTFNGTWCSKINGMCYWLDCANCYTQNWITVTYPWVPIPYQERRCNKGKIMSSNWGNKCEKCRWNPENCPDFEETGK